jgi:ribonuclease G
MSKELFVSSTPRETKVALVEDDQLTEVFFERENEYTLAGSIYKGRVTRVLPGMQSAFVDIGLERDAFLYVSDFLELAEEGDEGPVEVSVPRSAPALETHSSAARPQPEPQETQESGPEKNERPTTTSSPANGENHAEPHSGPRWSRRRRRGRRGRGLETAYRQPRAPETPLPSQPAYEPILLPGESIAKYQRRSEVAGATPAAAASETEAANSVETAATDDEQNVRAAESHEADSQTELTDHALSSVASDAPHSSELGNRVESEPSPLTWNDEPRSEQAASTEPAVDVPPPTDVSEEEEIEEEEAQEFTSLISDIFEDTDYDELEEETLQPPDQKSAEPAPVAAAGEVIQAAEESAIERTSEEEYESEGEDGELESPEWLPETEAPEESPEGDESAPAPNGHAAMRAAPAIAPYQQRAERRDLDRQRARRGGRRGRGRRMQRPPLPMIADLLKEGEEILVQIAKEPLGKKGARITSHIALPGRFLVYMPTVNHVGVSRKIGSEEERQRLKRIVSSERNSHGGFIVRTAAEGIREEDLRADIRFLKSLWNDIRNRAENSKSPALIYHDLNLVERVLRDLVTEDFANIWVDTEQEYERILRFVNRFQPSLVKRVKLYTKETPLFEQFNVQEELNKALKSKVWLKSGGYIVINQTEALVAIDVNTGKYVGKTARLEDTIVKTNIDAIKEIVRQIRLRDLGGIIVIDFIDMDERKNRQKVMQTLDEALRTDRAPSKVLAFNDFGLVAITRKRVKQSLERTLGQSCTYCTGTGFIKSPVTVCNEIYVEMRKMASPDPTVHQEQFDIN